MPNTHTSNAISADGLRYVNKNGSGRPQHDIPATSSRSCFLCGRFRQTSELKTKRFLGTNHMVCVAGCKT